MALYRRSSRFIFDSFRNYTSKFSVPKTPINFPKPTSRFPQISQPIFRNPVWRHGLEQNNQHNSPFLGGAKRFYNADKLKQIAHFRAKGYKRWFENPRHVSIAVFVSSGVVITLYMGKLETVPYTKRTHFVILSRTLEKYIGEIQFKKVKGEYKDKILPPLHPDSIRVQRISQEIIEALTRGLSTKEQSANFDNESRDALSDEEKWYKGDEVIDDQWVEKSRKMGQEMASQTGHLEGLKWEVIVVHEPVVNAFCLPGGEIVVFTGLLGHFKDDAEVAMVIGHEVGHAVARHCAEQMSRDLWLIILQLILRELFTPDIHVNTVTAVSNLLLRLPFSRRMEMEADYIGLLLVASAGYDPRVAPQVYEKLGKIGRGDSPLQDYLATHPSGKTRAQRLARAEVMEEAFDLYRESQTRHGIEGFL